MEIENFNFLLSKDNNYILYLVTKVTERFKPPTKVFISKQKANLDISERCLNCHKKLNKEKKYFQFYIIKTLNHYF